MLNIRSIKLLSNTAAYSSNFGIVNSLNWSNVVFLDKNNLNVSALVAHETISYSAVNACLGIRNFNELKVFKLTIKTALNNTGDRL